MSFFKYFFLLLVLVSTISCDKQWKKTRINGQVIDYSTGNPIDKANVVIYSYAGNRRGSEDFFQTSPSGKFEHDFKAWRTKEYFAQASHSEYFRPGQYNYPPSSEENLVHTKIELKKTNDLILELYSKADLRLTLKPFGTLDTSKKIKVEMPYYDIVALNYPLAQRTSKNELIYGPTKVAGNSTHVLKYYVFSSPSDSTMYTHEVYCKQNTLTEVTLSY